ncbi:hypothetical protein NM208_g234 [Fusarium decemcellulare]|uniref:Uncharacterized protein n=1 Tax=Fusarium decemcellulare TaxID=57161 RepID=A0ACC1T0G8_9HYPO|nr:hypothetical protein NM208_g234 [Fusarium decemcellulare]
MNILPRADNALTVNPPDGVNSSLSVNGSDWLWTVTAIYTASFLGLVILSFAAHESRRVFHYIFTVVLLVGSVSYYVQASDLGWTPIPISDDDHTMTQLFFAKYINWVVAFPSLALALGLLCGISWTTIVCNIAVSWFWVLTYLATAFISSDYKWGAFAFGTLAYVILAMSTINESHEAAEPLGIGRDYRLLSGWLNLLWLLYPVAFGLSDGSHKIGVTAGFVFFGVLDVLMVPVLAFAFLFLSRKWDWDKLNLAFSDVRVRQHRSGKGASSADASTAAV